MSTVTQRPQTLRPLRRLRETLRPAGAVAAEEHLHYDREARAWRTHEELERHPRLLALAGAEVGEAVETLDLQECA